MDKVIIDRKSSTALKAVLCLFVLLHHLIKTGNPVIDMFLHILGTTAVGGFFCLSGYGLIVNYKKYGMSYLKKLVFKRIPITYGIVIITNLAYLGIYYLTNGAVLSFANIITSVLYISSSPHFIQLYSWVYFLVDLLYYYIAFALIFFIVTLIKKINNKPQVASICYAVIILVVYIVVSLINHSPLTQRAIFCLPLGLLIGAYQDKLFNFWNKYKWYVFSIILIIVMPLIFFTDTYLIKDQLVPFLFCILMVSSIVGYEINNKILMFLGKISLYVYLSHGAVYMIFNHFCNLNIYVQFLLVSILSILFSIFIYLSKNLITKANRNKHKKLTL